MVVLLVLYLTNIGQNGVVVVIGSDDGIKSAKEAIHLVNREAHSADLTDMVQDLLETLKIVMRHWQY